MSGINIYAPGLQPSFRFLPGDLGRCPRLELRRAVGTEAWKHFSPFSEMARETIAHAEEFLAEIRHYLAASSQT